MTNVETTPPVGPETRASRTSTQGDVAGAAASTKMTKKRKGMIAALVAALVILALLFAWYLMNRKPLSALPGLSSTTMPHYDRSLYGATKPLGVAVTPSGDRVYVTESGGTRLVRVYDRAGKQTGTLKPPASTGAGHLPMYVAINPKTQDVYVSDRQAAAIYVYDASGKYLRTFAAKGVSGKFAPMGLAFGPDGSLYTTDVGGADTKSHRVLVFGPDGAFVREIKAAGSMSFPNGIVLDSRGDIEVADSNNGRLLVFDKAGKMLAMINPGVGEGDLGMPRGIAVDDAGRLFVVDTADHMVRVYRVDKSKVMPTYIGSFGDEGQLDGTFEYPNGVATDKRARVYITDRENNRVQVWGY
jgi:DNA-binding beta-propeller fold protein YncE